MRLLACRGTSPRFQRVSVEFTRLPVLIASPRLMKQALKE